jgi:tetratricopeptide (TPR) repeat protein
MDYEELLDVMDTLVDLKFLVESEDRFIFEHPKVMESIYDLIEDEERKDIHRNIAETFESMDDAYRSTVGVDLAVHHFHAGNCEKALNGLIARGKDQIQKHDLDPALRSMNMAIECIDEHEDNKDKDEKLIEILRMKGDILDQKGEVEQGLVVFRKGLEIAEKNGILKDQSLLHRKVADLLLKKFEWDETIEHYLTSLHISKKNDDEFEISQAFKGLGRIYLLQADYHRSIECYIKYLEFPETRTGSESIRGMIDIGEIYFQMGDFNQALAYYKLAIQKCEESGTTDEISIGYIKMANVLLKLGEVEDSKRYADLARETVHSTPDYSANVETLLQYTDLMLEVGHLEKADEVMTQLEGSIDSSDRLIRAFACRVKGILYSRKRDFRGSITHFKASISMMEELKVPYHLAITYFHFGLVRFQQMDVEGALEMLEKANSLFKNIKSLFYLNRTASKLREVSFIRDGLRF